MGKVGMTGLTDHVIDGPNTKPGKSTMTGVDEDNLQPASSISVGKTFGPDNGFPGMKSGGSKRKGK